MRTPEVGYFAVTQVIPAKAGIQRGDGSTAQFAGTPDPRLPLQFPLGIKRESSATVTSEGDVYGKGEAAIRIGGSV